MRYARCRSLVPGLFVAGLLLLPRNAANACLAFGEETVSVRGEEALVVYDDSSHREHLVRTADFASRSPFAFLVPVPAEPTLAAAPRRLFVDLFEIYRAHPEWPVVRNRGNGSLGIGAVGGALGDSEPTYVRQEQVAGLDTAVLAGRDAQGIENWLTVHGFRIPENASEWVGRYARAGYYFVAARYVPRNGSASITPLVISFDSPAPYFPYSEIVSSTGRGRRFRISVVTQHRVHGFLAPAAEAAEHAARAPWIAPSYARRAPRLPRVIGPIVGVHAQVPPWITTFDMRASARDHRDLWFAPHSEDGRVASSITERISNRPRAVYQDVVRITGRYVPAPRPVSPVIVPGITVHE